MALAVLDAERGAKADEHGRIDVDLARIDRRVEELGLERQCLLRLYAKGIWSEPDLDAQQRVMDEEGDALNEERLDLEQRKAQRIEQDQPVSGVRGVAHVIKDLPDLFGGTG